MEKIRFGNRGSTAPEAIRRYHFIFTGRVQGVGFRWRFRECAVRLGLTGWVENCCDGSVEAELQGTDVAVDRLEAFMGRQCYIRIDHTCKTELDLVPGERGFYVR